MNLLTYLKDKQNKKWIDVHPSEGAFNPADFTLIIQPLYSLALVYLESDIFTTFKWCFVMIVNKRADLTKKKCL